MKKPLTSLSKPDDLTKVFAGLALKDVSEEESESPLQALVKTFSGVSVTDAEPARMTPVTERLDELSLTEQKPAQTTRKSALSRPQRRSDLVENRDARSSAGNPKKSTEKANVEAGGYRPPLASRLPVPNQNVQPAAPLKVTAAPIKTPQAPVRDTPTKPTLATTGTATTRAPRRRPDSNPVLSPEVTAKSSKSVVTSPDERAVVSSPSSHGTTSSPRTGSVQCSGTAKTTGKLCRKRVKLSAACSESELDPTPSLFCHLHKEEIQTQDDFHPTNVEGKQNSPVKFSECIAAYLQGDTKMKLRLELVKPPSEKDTPGYVYAFEIPNPDRPDVIRLKVGRTTNLVKRLNQWDDQCRSQSHILRGWWPGKVEGGDRTGGSPLKGIIRPGVPGPLCHRVERLVHIELSDLSLHAPYLHPSWPKLSKPPPPGANAARSARTSEERCLQCGKMHKEIFTFQRPKGGHCSEMEWNEVVKPVIEKWGKFVEEHYT